MAMITRPSDKVMNVNIAYDDMMRPVLGPDNPFDTRKNKGMNSLAGTSLATMRRLTISLLNMSLSAELLGHVEEQSMDAHSFLQQQRTFAVHGYALNPSSVSNDPSSTFVGDVASAAENNFALIENIKGTHGSRRENKRKRQGKGDAGVVDGEGAYLGPWAGWEGEKEEGVEELEEDAEEWRAEKRRREEAQEATREKMKKAGEEKSVFHGQFFRPGPTVMSTIVTHVFPDKQANLLPITLEGRICISRRISGSISSRTRIPRLWKASSLRHARTPGYGVSYTADSQPIVTKLILFGSH